MGVLKRLEAAEYIETSTILKKRLALTLEGDQVIREGSQESLLFQLIPEDGLALEALEVRI